MTEPLIRAVETSLHALVDHFPDRHVGGPGNVHATAYVESQLRQQGWQLSQSTFEAVDAARGPARLVVDGREFPITPSPCTLPVDVAAELIAVDSLSALEAADLRGRVVLLHGEIARDQLLPRGFTFLEAPEHRHIYELLEDGGAVAVVGATGRGGGMGGGLYPYPLIEDGDFGLPCAHTTDTVGERLAARSGRACRLSIVSRRYPVHARQLTAATGPAGAPRVVVIAHLDSKDGSPGAVDNATGVAALLAIGSLLVGRSTPVRLELVPMNGEDHYSVGGEHCFVAANESRWHEVLLAVNLDAVGARGARSAASLYSCPPWLEAHVSEVMGRHPGVVSGEAWYESDHSLVASRGRPALALTSTTFRELCSSVTHTEHDTLDVVSAEAVADTARFVADLIATLPHDGPGTSP